MAHWRIRNGRLLDPVSGRDETADLEIVDGVVTTAGVASGPATEIDAAGCWVLPGGLDMHVHLREPGLEEAETVASGMAAAAAGGMTALGVMPNTTPPLDTPEAVAALLARGRAAGPIRLYACPCLTRGRAGRALADLEALAAAGARAFTDDGSTVPDEGLMREAMRRAAVLGLAVLDHALDPAARGHLHDGARAASLALAGIPSAAEARVVERDIRLAAETGCALHVQHVSARESTTLIRAARAAGLRVTGEATPHHLVFADADIPGPDTRFKMSPPLRAPADREALRDAVCDGTLGILATDHAPHPAAAKARPFDQAPNGVIGLETALAATAGLLVGERGMAPLDWARRWTMGPAAVLGVTPPALRPGAPADLVIFDPAARWSVAASAFRSRSRNTPFDGRILTGRVRATFCRGCLLFQAD